MNAEDAYKYLHDHATDILEPDGQSKNSATPKGYICPICNSGSGPKGTGITTKDKVHFTCWAGCFSNSDIIDILAKRDGYDHESNITKLRHACKAFNIELDNVRSVQTEHAPLDWNGDPIYEAVQTEPEAPAPEQPQTNEQKAPSLKAEPVNYSDLFLEWREHLDECDYLTKRGISLETQKKYLCGYCAEWKHPSIDPAKAKYIPTTPRIIIPTGPNSYIARDVRENIPADQEDYIKQKVGEIYISDWELKQGKNHRVFIVEGEIDALSIIDLGFNALSLGSINNRGKFVEILKQIPAQDRSTIILALDNDTRGTEATLDLEKQLQSLNIMYFLPKSSELYGNCKDANEALTTDREAFRKKLEHLNKTPEELYNDNSNKTALASFLEDYENLKDGETIKTGFSNLDEKLDGGLHAGLYVIGAISSLGKTTFTLQMADNIAKAGHDVIIFSLEMAQKELIAKSISRLTFLNMRPGENTKSIAASVTDLLSNEGRKLASKTRKERVREAVQEYGEYAGNIFIIEGLGDVTIDRIKNTIAQHVIYRKKTPVVIIDYLQIIAAKPEDKHATDKQNTDKAVLELKRISRDFKTPVFAISSFNRDNYSQSANMASFKESGAIEYSSDVLIGLQLYGTGTKGFDINEAFEQDNRDIELIILKNRRGKKNQKVRFDYYPMYECYMEK